MGFVQVIIDDTANKVITGTYSFDRAGGGVLEVPHGTNFPASPQAHELFWRDDESKLYKRNAANTAWDSVTSVAVSHASTHEPGGSDALTVDAAATTGSLRTLGTGAQQACSGADSRLSDARTPTAHATSHGSGGGDAVTVAISQVTDLEDALADKLPLDHVDEVTGAHPKVSNLLSTGLLAGGGLHVNTDPTKFDIDPAVGVVVDNWTDPAAAPVRTIVEFPGASGVTPLYIDGDETYIYLNADGDVVQSAVQFREADLRDHIYLGWVSHLDHETVDDAYSEPYTVVSPKHTLYDFLEAFGAFNIIGNEYSAADSGLLLRRTAGKTFDAEANYQTDAKNPNVVTTDAVNPAELIYYYRDENGEWVNDSTPTLYVDPDHYDTGTGLASVPSGKWTIQLIMFYAPWGTTDIQYGQVVFDTYSEARARIFDPVVLNPYNALWDTFRGWLFVKQGATDLSDPAQAVFVSAGKLGLVSTMGGGGSGGEVNTASNVGTAGVGVFASKVGVDLRFRKLYAASTKLSVVLDAPNNKIDFDVLPGQIAHQDLSGAGTNAHSAIDTHLASTNNPHSTTKAQVGLSNVTDDAQLKRAAGDFATFTEKAAPVSADLLLIEDSETPGGTKKKVQAGNLPGYDANAIHKNVAAEISGITEKAAPVDADLLVIEDSAASNAKKRVQAGNLPRRWRWGAKILTVDANASAKADYTTIQAALNAATEGTVILVAPGTYDEVLTLKDGVALIGTGSRRWGGGHVMVMHMDTAPFDLLTKNSAGTAYLENIIFVAYLSGTTSGTVSALNLVAGGVRAKDCTFQGMTDASAGTQVIRGVRSTAYMQASECAFVAADAASRNTSVAAVSTSATLEADRCKFSMSTSSSTEGALYITAGIATLWDPHLTAGGGQPIRRTGGTVNLYGVAYVSGTETDDADDPASASAFPKNAYGVLLTNGTGARAYKLPCRALSGDPASPVDGDIWYNNATGLFRCRENGTSLNLRPDAGEFGKDYQAAVSEGTSTTTSASFQTKVTLTTGALTGTYLVSWQAELTINSTIARFQARLYNNTDAAELCFHDAPAVTSGAYKLVSGFALVTFAGASKTLLLQYASQGGFSTVTIRRARMTLVKVSA